jgi:molybdopterin converting factor small subunit
MFLYGITKVVNYPGPVNLYQSSIRMILVLALHTHKFALPNFMKVKIVAYGIAKDIIKAREKNWQVEGVQNISDLKSKLISDYPEFSKLTKLSFAIEEEYRDDDYSLKDGDEVVIIPPVSGG